jgi:signal transduction histidine kinase
VIDLGKSVTQITNLQQCLGEIHQGVQTGLGFDRVGLFLYDAESRQLQGAFGTDMSGQIEDTSSFVQSVDKYAEWQNALRDPRGLNLIDEYTNLHKIPADSEMFGVKQHITLAAWAGEEPVALIAADNLITQRPFSAEQVEALQLFAGYAGLAIENARWNAQLEQRVAERTSELEAANRELEALAYTIAHDLRIPARAMHGFASILKETEADKLDSEAMRRLDRIRESAGQMGQLVDDLLDFMHCGRTALRLKQVAVNGMVANIMEDLQASQPEHQIEVQLAELPNCQADPDLLKRVWLHLLKNAIKFSSMRPVSRVEIGAFIAPDGQTGYFVRDNGIGFDMKFVGKLFGAFQRLHHPDEFEGTGMGLAIVQRIVQRHGGRIWAESEVDQGATFYFTLGQS